MFKEKRMLRGFIICLLLLSSNVYAAQEGNKFINPVFNNLLESLDYKTSHIRITPRSLYYVPLQHPEYTQDINNCTLLEQTDTAVLLRCKEEGFAKERYEFFFIRGQIAYVESSCYVHNCFFYARNNVMGTSSNGLSEVFSGDDKWCDNQPKYERVKKLKCVDELKALGWDKYLPLPLQESN